MSADETRPPEPVARRAPSIVWPYLVFGPLVPAVPLLLLALLISQAVRHPSLANYGIALALAYLVFGPVCLVLALIHRQMYRNSGQHRLWPVVGWALMFGVALAAVLILTEHQASGLHENLVYAAVSLGCMALMAMAGFFAVLRVNRPAGAQPPPAPQDEAAP